MWPVCYYVWYGVGSELLGLILGGHCVIGPGTGWPVCYYVWYWVASVLLSLVLCGQCVLMPGIGWPVCYYAWYCVTSVLLGLVLQYNSLSFLLSATTFCFDFSKFQ